jgi:dienelactone hydrolase
MWFRSMFDCWISRSSRIPSARQGCNRARCRWPARLEVEFLEDRCLPSTVHPLFDLGSTTSAAFPSDRFTVLDTAQNTGRRVNLPLPDPATHPSDYQDTQVLNTLDGFNLQPRLSIPFSGPIDVNSVSSNDVFLVSLGDTLNHHDHGGRVVGINQVVWDPAANTLHVTSDESLDQHTRYALIVTNGVDDAGGLPVEATLAFRLAPLTLAFSHDPVLRSYGQELVEGLVAAHRAGVREQDIVTASVFTTESATAILEKMRDQIHAATPELADFNLGPDGTRTVFSLDQVTGIAFNEQNQVDPPGFASAQLSLPQLRIIPGAVGQIAFGKYLSPDYEVHPGEFIPPVGTRAGTPVVQRMNEVYFNLYLPSGPAPEGGWPVVIFGHGTNGNKSTDSVTVAATNAANGLATIAINVPGNGFGPLSTMTVNQTSGEPVTFSAGGRSIDQNGDNEIGNIEGQLAAPPRTIIAETDALRQTVADLMQLVRVIEVGMDVNGDGTQTLDPSHIYYQGFSLGGSIGTMLLSVEPDVRAGVFDVPGGSRIDASRLGTRRNQVGSLLDSRTPSLLNTPGITSRDGVAVSQPYFNENMPLRDGIPLTVQLDDGTTHVIQSPVINTVPGAEAIQEVFENMEWVSQSANPVAYAPHLRKDPLPGVPVRPVLILFGKGDQTAPNPVESAVVRAGDLADRTTFYRNDLAFAEDQGVPKDPHAFMVRIDSSDPLVAAIAAGAQTQIATFFESDGAEIIQPEPARFFEVPIAGALPEDLNFIPTAPPSPAVGAAPATRASTGTSSAAFTVPLPRPYGPQVNLPPADSADGTASTSSGADHAEATYGNLTSAASETAKTIMVPVQANKKKLNEPFVLQLWEAGSVFLPDAQRIATILDDNPLGGKN